MCQDDYCNGIIFPLKNRLTCYECLGEGCEADVSDEKFCERLHADEACVSVFDNSDKVLERGCLSTVQHSAICSSTNHNCLKCSFSECNTHKSKQEVYHCVSCNSKDDPSCATATMSPGTKTCKSNQCYSNLFSDSNNLWQHVEKGCVSDLLNPSSCTGSSCAACVGDLCNNVLYPTDRMTCLSCTNDGCKQPTVPSTYCALYNRTRQACVTLYNSNSEVNFRGCYADAPNGTQDVCDDTSQLLCTKCQSKNCNQDTTRRGKKCYKCQGLECFMPTPAADVVDCLSNCYVGVNERGETVRDCSNAITNTTMCGPDDNGINRCSVCTDDLCNAIQFPLFNRLQCHVCNEEDCKASDDNLEFCKKYHAQERCITVFSKGGKVEERGCSSSLQNQRYCVQNYGDCLQCPSTGCNINDSKLNRLCVVCNSTADPNCVINPTAILTTKVCSEGCYTRLVKGALMRGCVEDLDIGFECGDQNKCKHCNDIDKCNVDSYPPNRKSCLSCLNTAECENPNSEPCINYNENEKCATIFNGCKLVLFSKLEFIQKV